MWNAISLVQDLNSCHRAHFLRRKPLHHGHINYQLWLIWKIFSKELNNNSYRKTCQSDIPWGLTFLSLINEQDQERKPERNIRVTDAVIESDRRRSKVKNELKWREKRRAERLWNLTHIHIKDYIKVKMQKLKSVILILSRVSSDWK